MRGLLCTSVAVAVAAACYSSALVAQETTSSVRGNVTADGKPVVGATVTVVHVPTGTTVTSLTGATGSFSASGLRPGGPYTVTVAAAGMPSARLTDISLSVGETADLPVVLASGGDMQEIVVEGTSLPNADGPTSVFGRETIEGVASVARDVRDIARRDPFASFNPTTRGIQIAGQNNRTNRFAVDGVRFSDNFGLQQGGLPTTRGPVPLDAVEQMSVKIAPYDITEGDFQGGSINIVLRSGSNDLTGSAFYTYTDDSLTGDSSRGTPVRLDFSSKTWGAFLSGPILDDRLFFAFAYEQLEETNPADFGLAGAPNVVPNLSQAQLDQVSSIARSVYNYDTLGIRTVLPETDKKFTGKLDWNITDGQRLTYTGIFQDGYLQSTGSGSNAPVSPSLNYRSYATNEPEQVNSHVLQLNSRWSNNFSTETRLNYRDYAKVPSSLGDAGFAQFQVCLDPVTTGQIFQCSQNGTPRLFFGTEQFSQADVVKQEQYGLEVVGRLNFGDHALKAQVAYNALEITNVFVASALGVYYFDSIAALQARQASQLTWQNSITGNLADVEASFGYDQVTFGLQDSWNLSPSLNLTYGMRFDLYEMSDQPPLNQNFLARYGFANNSTIDGNLVAQPRVNLTWRTTDRLTVRGGFGLFNGGAPDVFLGNSFSVAGVFGNTLTNITRTPTGCALGTAATSPALPANVCAAAINNVNGRSFDPLVRNFLQTNTAALAGSPVNAMTTDFELPSTWKASLSLDYDADLGRFGDGWNFGLDLYQGWVHRAANYTDLRLTQTGTDPTGRPIYADTFTRGTNADLLLSNTSRGRSTVVVGRVDKQWDNGLGANFSYTYSDIKSLSDMGTALTGGTTGNGTYGASPMVDANFAAYGISAYEIRHNLKLGLDWARPLFGENMTRLSLFAEYRTGTPYSLTMNSPGARSLWGTTGTSSRYLLYVPDVSSITADARVRYANVTVYQQFRDYVTRMGLAQGETVAKNSERSPWYFKVDLHAEQEIPVPFIDDAKFKLFADVENLLNLINDDWGAFRYFNPLTPIVNVSCAQSVAGSCRQYSYDQFTPPALVSQNRIGLWGVRLGFRVEF